VGVGGTYSGDTNVNDMNRKRNCEGGGRFRKEKGTRELQYARLWEKKGYAGRGMENEDKPLVGGVGGEKG